MLLRITLLLWLTNMMTQPVVAQKRTVMLSKNFTIYTDTSLYTHLSDRLPDLVCSGILFHSSLRVYEQNKTLSSDALDKIEEILDNSNRNTETAKRKIIDSLHVSYYMTGMAVFEKDAFSLSVTATNFNTPPLQYEVKLSPLNQFQKIIDEASYNLNRLVDLDQAGDQAVKINITSFDVSFKDGYAIPGNNLYSPEYYAIYLSQNLKNSDSSFYVIKPHLYSNDSLNFNNDTAALNNEITISGKVTFLKDSLKVYPFMYGKKLDTIYLDPFAARLSEKDVLNANMVESIQTYLDDLIRNHNPDSSNIIKLSNFTPDDFKNNCENAIQSGNPKSALLFSNEFIRKFPDRSQEGYVLKAKALYATGNYFNASRYLDEVLTKNPSNKEAIFMEGLIFLQTAKYNQSRILLNKLSDSLYGPKKRINFYRGQCYFYLDSLPLAKKEFLKQITYPNDPKSDCYYYLGRIEEKRKHIKEAINFYENARQYATSDPVYTQTLESAYGQYIYTHWNDHLSDEATIDPLITKGIKDNFIGENSLLGLSTIIQAISKKNKNNNIKDLSQRAIEIYKEYQRIKDNFSDRLWENEGILYIYIGEMDSALMCMKKMIRTSNYQKERSLIYLSIGEIYFLKNSLRQADSVFTFIDNSIAADSATLYEKETALLLSFYQTECKICLRRNYLASQEKFKQLLANRKIEDIIIDWSFKEFNDWAKAYLLKKQSKTLLLDNICQITKFTVSPYCSQ